MGGHAIRAESLHFHRLQINEPQAAKQDGDGKSPKNLPHYRVEIKKEIQNA
jgi:hypothetical protein